MPGLGPRWTDRPGQLRSRGFLGGGGWGALHACVLDPPPGRNLTSWQLLNPQPSVERKGVLFHSGEASALPRFPFKVVTWSPSYAAVIKYLCAPPPPRPRTRTHTLPWRGG